MANFETEVYELFKLLTPPGDKHDEKVNNYCSSNPRLVQAQAHDSAMSLKIF